MIRIPEERADVEIRAEPTLLRRLPAVIALVIVGTSHIPVCVQAQDQWGGQQRADAASQMIVLSVQQAISSLPPSSGQAFAYTYDPETLTFVASDQLGPTAFLSTYTVGKGQLTFRAAASYFDMSDSFGPITYLVESAERSGYAKLGLNASARVGLLNLSANYGLTNRVELSFTLPISIVDANASQTSTVDAAQAHAPAAEVDLAGAGTVADLEKYLRSGALVLREDSFEALGFNFNSGTEAGIGRIALGGKGLLYATDRLRFSVAPQLFLPSPSEAEFAGSDSAAIYPRVVAQVKTLERLFLTIDLGYDYDFEESTLRRFAWNVGAWIPGTRFSVDFGVGGSKYETPIRWTPSVAYGTGPRGEFTITALGDNELGTNFVDFLGGVKVRLAERLVASGAVTVPLTTDEFQPVALGTIALEFHL